MYRGNSICHVKLMTKSSYRVIVVLTRSGSVNIAHNMSHASLVAKESGEMNGFPRVIGREALYFASVASTSLLGHEPEMAMARRRKLSV